MRVYVSIQKLYSQYYFNECKCIYIYTYIFAFAYTCVHLLAHYGAERCSKYLEMIMRGFVLCFFVCSFGWITWIISTLLCLGARWYS